MPEQLSLHAADAEDIRRRQGAEFHEPEMIIPLDGTLCLKQNASLQTHDPGQGRTSPHFVYLSFQRSGFLLARKTAVTITCLFYSSIV